MNDLHTFQLETDYRKWLAFSESAGSRELLKTLKKALKNRRSKDDIVLTRDKQVGSNVYFISEKGNSATLQVSEDQYPEFIQYFSRHYLGENDKEEKVAFSTQQIHTSAPKANFQNEPAAVPSVQPGNVGIGLTLLGKISSTNKTRHAFKFSLIALALQQIYIIPENFGDLQVEQAGPYSMLVIMLLVWGASLWAYIKFFPSTNTYRENLKLTWSYFAIWWLLGFTEVSIIMWIQGDFNIWFAVFLIFLGQFIAAIMGLFLTVIAYYLRGGKVVKVS